ncbi:MAG: O-antigen ligase family protein [Polaromonas sp.]|nr:O-antigen ligase family protein [Polaromonas sp.]
MATSQGAELASLTGRDKIWAIAYDEWQRNPVFGYGPTLWNAEFRTSIAMPYATHGHNQFMDTLSRSGSVGAVSLVLYSLVLLALSIRYTRQSGGLSLALFLAIAMRSVSEVPLALFGYNLEVIAQALLLAVLAGCAVEVAAKNRLLADSRRYAPPSRKPITPLAARSVP